MRPTLLAVLRTLGTEGLIDPEAVSRFVQAGVRGEGAAAPWFIRVLLGFGAWVAALFLVLFLVVIDLIDGKGMAFLVGLVLTGSAVALRRAVAGRSSDFLEQLALALLLTGQVFAVVGFGEMTDSVPVTAAAMLGLEALTVAFFPDAVGRFLAVLAAAGAVVALFHDGSEALAWNLAVLATALPAGLLWWRRAALLAGPLPEAVHPVGYGLVTAALLLLLSSLGDLFGAGGAGPLAGLGLTAGVTGLAAALLGPRRAGAHGLLSLGGLLVLGATTLPAPGVMAALGVLLLGFHARERVLQGLAWVFLAVFLTGFYYNLDVTLLVKSGILVASGALLLGLREGVRRW